MSKYKKLGISTSPSKDSDNYYSKYKNDYNYYNKNIIKMSKIRENKIKGLKSEKKNIKQKLKLPKILIASAFLTGLETNSNIYQKDSAIQNTSNHSERMKNLNFFDDLFNTIDNLEISTTNIKKEKSSKELESNITNEISFADKSNSADQKNILPIITEISENNNYKPLEPNGNMSKVYKDILQFNDYQKYKYTKKGINYPSYIEEDDLPEFKGDSSSACSYFNYRLKIHNPDKVYYSIPSFNNKFNKELKRISNTYGGNKGKGRLASNPKLRINNPNMNYNRYKDIKIIENRYADNVSYKYKLLPLINRKNRGFDYLGEKIFKLLINNK